MSFREKTAWVMVLVLSVAGAFYGWEVAGAWLAGATPPPPSIKLAIVYLLILVAGAVVSMSALGASAPDEASAPADERERLILDKAGNWSGYVLGIGAVYGVLNFYSYQDGNMLFHLVVGSLMASQIAEYVFQITLYRRGVA